MGPSLPGANLGTGSERQEFISVAYCCQQGVKFSLPEPPGEIRFDRKGAICDYMLLFLPDFRGTFWVCDGLNMKESVYSDIANINLDDAMLVERCRQGDSAAMERLILKYQNRIYNVILKMCGNPDDAAELTQDTFVKVLENIDRFAGRSGFYTWAFRIAVNLTLNYCQRSVRVGYRSLDAEEQEGGSQAKSQLKEYLSDDSSPDPSVVAQSKELCNIVEKALMKLDGAHRMVVVLRDIEGMSYAQIAKVLEVELGTVKSRLSRARSNLREILEAML
jgi:RNA polymerase sigma-70 factor (ECF subfamily)